ncbi:MAG TPA: HAD domain-containing protein [Caproicibacter sp.]|nr:HAD domain-containing protein [Caproicibacter sp.]
MKVIFLDIDGVLNANSCDAACQSAGYIDESKVRMLSDIIQKTNSVVVLHSGWRFLLNESLEPVGQEAENLLSLLEKYKIKLYDRTPDFSTEEIKKTEKFSLVKAAEILSWLNAHKEVDNYLVLDDLDLHNAIIAKHQIRTNSADGLTQDDVSCAIKVLNLH